MRLFTLFRTFWGVFKKVEKIRLDIYLCFVFYSQPQYLKVSGCSGEVLDYSDHIEYQRWQTLFQKIAHLKHLHHGELNGLVTCCAIHTLCLFHCFYLRVICFYLLLCIIWKLHKYAILLGMRQRLGRNKIDMYYF